MPSTASINDCKLLLLLIVIVKSISSVSPLTSASNISFTQNYTDTGFKVIQAPEKVWKLLKDFWDANHGKEQPENWAAGNTYTNHWESPTYLLSVENEELQGGGFDFRQEIWNAAKSTIEEWTGQELKECSLYGIRIYTEGSVLVRMCCIVLLLRLLSSCRRLVLFAMRSHL